jgi:hypothetical protein
MKLTPAESFRLSKLINYAIQQKKTVKPAIIHKFGDNDNNETTTSLQVDFWERNEKSGFGIVVNKDKTSISTPFSKIDFMFFSALLERWSVDAAFTERVEKTPTNS